MSPHNHELAERCFLGEASAIHVLHNKVTDTVFRQQLIHRQFILNAQRISQLNAQRISQLNTQRISQLNAQSISQLNTQRIST